MNANQTHMICSECGSEERCYPDTEIDSMPDGEYVDGNFVCCDCIEANAIEKGFED